MTSSYKNHALVLLLAYSMPYVQRDALMVKRGGSGEKETPYQNSLKTFARESPATCILNSLKYPKGVSMTSYPVRWSRSFTSSRRASANSGEDLLEERWLKEWSTTLFVLNFPAIHFVFFTNFWSTRSLLASSSASAWKKMTAAFFKDSSLSLSGISGRLLEAVLYHHSCT